MNSKLLRFSALFLGIGMLSAAYAGLRLEISGQPVTADGEVTLFQYWPNADSEAVPRVEIQSFFADLRCSGLPKFEPSNPQFALELDQIIKGEIAEPEAKYDMSDAESITYAPDTGVISVNGAKITADCMHEIPAVGDPEGNGTGIEPDGSAKTGAFWIGGFEQLFTVDYNPPTNTDFDFQIQVNNNNPILPLRDIKVNFRASVDIDQEWFQPASADVKPAGGFSDSWIWTIPLLWPAGAMDDQTTLDVATTDLNAGVAVGELASLTRSSYPATTPELITVVNTSTNR